MKIINELQKLLDDKQQLCNEDNIDDNVQPRINYKDYVEDKNIEKQIRQITKTYIENQPNLTRYMRKKLRKTVCQIIDNHLPVGVILPEISFSGTRFWLDTTTYAKESNSWVKINTRWSKDSYSDFNWGITGVEQVTEEYAHTLNEVPEQILGLYQIFWKKRGMGPIDIILTQEEKAMLDKFATIEQKQIDKQLSLESYNEDNEAPKTLDYFINKLENRYPIDFEQRELGLYIFNSNQTALSWDDEFKLIKAMRRGWKEDNDTQKYYAEKSLKSTIKEANKIAKNLRKQAKEQKNKNESIKESKGYNEALQVGEAEILEWLKQRQVKVGHGFNKLSKEGTAYYMAKLINSLDENIINKIKEADFSNFNTKEFTLENKEALEAPKVVPCNSTITHLVCLYINPETNKTYNEKPTEEETLRRSIKIKMNKLYNKKTGWDRKGYYFLQKNGNKYEIVTNLGKGQHEVVISADSLQELNDILAEKLNKGQNNSKNESIKENTSMDKYKPMYDKVTELAQNRAKIDFVSKMNLQELVNYAVKAIKQNDANISDVENMLNKANYTPGQIEDILDKIRTSLDEAHYKSIETKTNAKALIERLEKLTEETVDILIPGPSSIIKDKVNELGLKDCIISTEDFFGDKPHSAKDGVLFYIKPECKQQFMDAINEYGLAYEVFSEGLTLAFRKIAESEQI